MSNKPGVYRVTYRLPGSVGNCTQQFLYTKSQDKNLKKMAKKYAVTRESHRYNINKSKINIISINFVREIFENQKELTDSYI